MEEPCLLAWITPTDPGRFAAGFVGSDARARQPATRLCATADEARQWIEDQAAALNTPVAWRHGAPIPSG